MWLINLSYLRWLFKRKFPVFMIITYDYHILLGNLKMAALGNVESVWILNRLYSSKYGFFVEVWKLKSEDFHEAKLIYIKPMTLKLSLHITGLSFSIIIVWLCKSNFFRKILHNLFMMVWMALCFKDLNLKIYKHLFFCLFTRDACTILNRKYEGN